MKPATAIFLMFGIQRLVYIYLQLWVPIDFSTTWERLMRMFPTIFLTAYCSLVVAIHFFGQDSNAESSDKQSSRKERKQMHAPEKFLGQCVGKWQGSVKTWFEPGKLADESRVSGEIVSLLNGNFFRHTYEGTMKGKPRHGEETLAMNSITKKFQVCWFDDFHMSGAILISEGDAIEHGFSVIGEYDWAPGKPRGGWRTDYEMKNADHLTITAYNIMPDGQVSKAVETIYERVNK